MAEAREELESMDVLLCTAALLLLLPSELTLLTVLVDRLGLMGRLVLPAGTRGWLAVMIPAGTRGRVAVMIVSGTRVV